MVKVWIVSEFLNNIFKTHRDSLDTDRADNNIILYASAVEYLKAVPLNKLIVDKLVLIVIADVTHAFDDDNLDAHKIN